MLQGAIISISHFQDPNAFLYADGHVKQKIVLKNFNPKGVHGHQSNSDNISKEMKELLSQFRKETFSGCLFQIYPKVANTY